MAGIDEPEGVPNETARKYEDYYNHCERANRIPLCFDAWIKAGEPD